MGKSNIYRWIVLILSFQAIAPATHSQVIEVDAAIGYGATDLKARLLGSEPYDWSNLSGYATAQAFYPINKTLSIGISAGYHHLYWYEMKHVSLYGYVSYSEYSANATRLLALVRYNFGNNFIDLGAGPFIFGDYTDLGTVVSIGHAFKLTDKLAIPIKANCNAIFERNDINANVNIVSLTISAGISYRIK